MTNANLETATFGAGCFWGVQQILRDIPGVVSTRVGYTGGKTSDPTYQKICQGDTQHAEAVEITFDPHQVRYEELLEYFWRLHDPTQKDRQGADVGTQYRSVIFYHNEEQRKTAEESLRRFDGSDVFDRPVVTEIVKATSFYLAEEMHQDYFVKHPGPSCHLLRDR